jgi:hypothetical protein
MITDMITQHTELVFNIIEINYARRHFAHLLDINIYIYDNDNEESLSIHVGSAVEILMPMAVLLRMR